MKIPYIKIYTADLLAKTRLGAYGAVSRTLEEFRTHWAEFLNS